MSEASTMGLIETLESLRSQLLKDAERYRWLRDNCSVWGSDRMVRSDLQAEAAAMWLLGSTDITETGIDAAIDAAMEQSHDK